MIRIRCNLAQKHSSHTITSTRMPSSENRNSWGEKKHKCEIENINIKRKNHFGNRPDYMSEQPGLPLSECGRVATVECVYRSPLETKQGVSVLLLLLLQEACDYNFPTLIPLPPPLCSE